MSEELIEHKLQSGKTLRFNISTFDNGKNLYQTMLTEAKQLNLSTMTELDESLFIQVIMLAFSSKPLEAAIWACFDKAIVDGEKLDKQYFSKVENRGDYLEILVVIAKANIMPFMSSLYAQFRPLFQSLMKSTQA